MILYPGRDDTLDRFRTRRYFAALSVFYGSAKIQRCTFKHRPPHRRYNRLEALKLQSREARGFASAKLTYSTAASAEKPVAISLLVSSSFYQVVYNTLATTGIEVFFCIRDSLSFECFSNLLSFSIDAEREAMAVHTTVEY